MTDIAVVSEPRTYDLASPNSFFRDVWDSHWGDLSAQHRLDNHSAEVGHEIRRESREGQRAHRALVRALSSLRPGASRKEIELEARAGTSTSMAGFTTPQYLLDQFVEFRGTQRAFVDQTTMVPLPSVGLSVSIPAFTNTASAGIVSEGTSVAETDPTGQYLTAAVQTISGDVTASKQLLDRASTQGFTFDAFVYMQLRENYDQTVNTYVLGQALANGASVTPASGSFSIGNFYQDVATAREELYDTLGTRLPATHVFTTSDLYGYCTRQLDSSQRPIIVPEFAPGNPLWPDENVEAWKQFTGTVLPGTLMWFVDDGNQPHGGNTSVIVSRPDTVVTMEGDEPLIRVVDQALPGTLQSVIQLYNYVAAIPRYPSGTAYVTGSAYPTTAA